MSITHRSDTSLIPGKHHSGDRGLGVLGSAVPGSGAHGPAIPFPSLLPADMGKEVMIRILSIPAALTFFQVDELGRVLAEGPPGTHQGSFQVWVAGLDRGISTYTVGIGPSGALAGVAVSAKPFNVGALQGVMPPSGALSGANIGAGARNTGVLAGSIPAAGMLGGTNVSAPARNTGALQGVLPASGGLTGANMAQGLANSGALAGLLPPSGWLGGMAISAGAINTGALQGVMPPSGSLSGEARGAGAVNTGALIGRVISPRGAGAATYAGLLEYIQRYGLAEASQLLADEQRLLTQDLLTESVSGVYSGTATNDQVRAADEAFARAQRALERTSRFMDGYLRAAVTLPLAGAEANNAVLADCCSALARYDLADDCDNLTERMRVDREFWLKWLADVSAGRVQLSSTTGAAMAEAVTRTRFGRTKSAVNWDSYNPVNGGRR